MLTAARQAEVAELVDTSRWRRVGHTLGSWPGGLHRDPDGHLHYLKLLPDAHHARLEVLAAALCELAGSETCAPQVAVHRAQYGVVSRWLAPARSALIAMTDAGFRRSVQDGLAADAWVGNLDVIGLGLLNVPCVRGRAVRIDFGGTLTVGIAGDPRRFRGTVDEWDALLGGPVSSWRTLRAVADPLQRSVDDWKCAETRRWTRAALHGMTVDQKRRSIDRVLAIDPSAIGHVVRSSGLDTGTTDTLTTALLARREDLARRRPSTGQRPDHLRPRGQLGSEEASA